MISERSLTTVVPSMAPRIRQVSGSVASAVPRLFQTPTDSQLARAASTIPEIRVTSEQADGSKMIAGDRRTVTALDIKRSTELMKDLEPEQAQATVDPALKLMSDTIRRRDTCAVQSTGGGIFAVFGAPVAHEDHPSVPLRGSTHAGRTAPLLGPAGRRCCYADPKRRWS